MCRVPFDPRGCQNLVVVPARCQLNSTKLVITYASGFASSSGRRFHLNLVHHVSARDSLRLLAGRSVNSSPAPTGTRRAGPLNRASKLTNPTLPG